MDSFACGLELRAKRSYTPLPYATIPCAAIGDTSVGVSNASVRPGGCVEVPAKAVPLRAAASSPRDLPAAEYCILK